MVPQGFRGYYYDAEKGRYFKVEHSKTAPSDAAWSSDKVKKRKLEDEAAAAQVQRLALNKNRITRSDALNAPLMGGFLAREYGQHIRDLRDVGPASFAQGIIAKGKRDLDRDPEAVNVKHMTVVGTLPGRPFCAVYNKGYESPTIWSTSLPRDNNGDLDVRLLRESDCSTTLDCMCTQYEQTVPQLSDLKYSAKTDLVFVTSKDPGNRVTRAYALHAFAPKRLGHCDNDIGPTGRYKDARNRKYTSNTVCIAPPTSNHICLVGTDKGVAEFDRTCRLRLCTPLSWRGKPFIPDSFRDVFAIDFHASNPDIVLFGGRPGKLCVGDLRQEVNQWDVIQIQNSIAHIKSVSENQVLVAGVSNSLSVFDLRYCNLSRVWDRGINMARRATPIVTMPDYKNGARFDLGLDYDRGSGIVAAAHDDSKVRLYSVRSGNRLPSRDIDKIYSEVGPIHTLQFANFDGDKTPSLFVGEKGCINFYSFGVEKLDDEA
ncbi:hypothetical protein F5Y06DRAFT_271408 [Hypoxylon sp. FL0890]|nr:hypothetical protein F5Y06DRAFT_271408 [Hypoxylon sp. FL0890]